MPVSRNLSLPSSIEARQKNRPETLYRSDTEVRGSSFCTIQRSKPVSLNFMKVSRPSFLPTLTTPSSSANTTNSNNKQNEVAKGERELQNESNKAVADFTNPNANAMGVDTTTTRGVTLSQPCLLRSSTVGATQIFPHLFLGSQKDVVDESMMQANGITYVLNVSKTCVKPEFIDEDHFHRISVRDSYQEKMTPHIREAIEFIEKVRKLNERVIVHCLAGVSRSATVAIAYVLHYLRISFEEAYSFVKEKRQSISPNFNFLGQLMEFESSLRHSGHLACKRTGSLSEEGNGDDTEPKFGCHGESAKNSTRVHNIFDAKSNCSPLDMPATCSFTCSTFAVASCSTTETTLRISTPASSFCRRRNGPTFSKSTFSAVTTNANNNSSNRKCDSALPTLHGGQTPFEDPEELVVDVRVKVPNGRLGSDGFEKDESMACYGNDSYASDAFSSLRCQEPLVEYAMDCSEDSDAKFAKPKTAPNTPVIGRSTNEAGTHWCTGNLEQLALPKMSRHRRCASGGGIGTVISQSPLSMKRRFEAARTERSSSIGELSFCDQSMDVDRLSPVDVKRGASFSGSYYNHSESSSRSPRKFISFNSRSPKILRKSLQLNVCSVYSNDNNAQHRNSGTCNKSESAVAPFSTPSVLGMDAPVPVFDCSHSMSDGMAEPPKLDVAKRLALKEQTTLDTENADSLVIDSMLPWTLSSPGVDHDGLPHFSSTNSTKITSPATCPALTRDMLGPSFAPITSPPRFTYKGSFAFASSSKTRQITDAQTSQPFVLSASCNLKPKWRKDRRRQSVDSGYLSSQASSQASSSFTSPTSQQLVFGLASAQETFAEVSMENSAASSPVSNTCHIEGAFAKPDEVTNSNGKPDSRNSNVRPRNTVELVGCS